MIQVNFELHQLLIFFRAGSRIEVGDLNWDWRKTLAATTRPHFKVLDAGVRERFEHFKSGH